MNANELRIEIGVYSEYDQYIFKKFIKIHTEIGAKSLTATWSDTANTLKYVKYVKCVKYDGVLANPHLICEINTNRDIDVLIFSLCRDFIHSFFLNFFFSFLLVLMLLLLLCTYFQERLYAALILFTSVSYYILQLNVARFNVSTSKYLIQTKVTWNQDGAERTQAAPEAADYTM